MGKKILYGFLLGLIGFLISIILVPFIAIVLIIYITNICIETGYEFNENEHEDLDVHIDTDHEINIIEDVE